MTDVELSWAAGLWEGEGSIHISACRLMPNGQRRLGHLKVKLAMTDKEIVDWFHARWHGTCGDRMAKGGRRRVWAWEIGGHRAADFLADLYPFVLSERVRSKVALALAFQSQKVAGGVINRSAEYAVRQQWYVDQMRRLNVRGVAA